MFAYFRLIMENFRIVNLANHIFHNVRMFIKIVKEVKLKFNTIMLFQFHWNYIIIRMELLKSHNYH